MIRGIHHLGLTVRSVDASAAWYEEVLGFRRDGEFENPGGTRRKIFALPAWEERLSAAGVIHSPVAAANSIPGAAVLVFRDPDQIQLELFADPE
jgi:glyoxylase I family protein